MDEDAEQAAWAQLDNEHERFESELANDPGYWKWIESLTKGNENGDQRI